MDGDTWKLWDSMSHGCGSGPESYCAPTGDGAHSESETWQKQAKSDNASTFVFMVQTLECLLLFICIHAFYALASLARSTHSLLW